MQLPTVIAQGRVAHDQKLISIVTSLVMFSQLIGCATGLAIAGAVFNSKLRHQLSTLIPGAPESIIDEISSNIEVVFSLPPDERVLAIQAYVQATGTVLLVGVPAAAAASLSAIGIGFGKIAKVV